MVKVVKTRVAGDAVPRLSMATLSLAKSGVAVPKYDRSKTTIGVVHFGPGAFHRGHQACYLDTLLERDPRWAISAAELRPTGPAAAAVPQDNLYIVAELDANVRYRVVGSHKEYLTANGDADKIFGRLQDPRVRLVTMTVTEKGYCLDGNGRLDLNSAGIKSDLADPRRPTTVIGWVAEALALRKKAKLAPFIPVSCDNVVMNGHKLRRATLDFVEACGDRDLGDWITENVVFPSTMVDSITPAATEETKHRVAVDTGLRDEAPVQREAFQQWVVEDVLGEDAPDLASVGVLLTNDVGAYERAKLRLLNGAHSTLTYAGLLRGHTSIGEAMDDATLAKAVEHLMREDMIPTLRKVPGFNFDTYVTALLTRFRNPALTHKLIQIAADGSQKLPHRILEPLLEAMSAGRNIRGFLIPLSAWMRFVVRQAFSADALEDPIGEKLKEIGRSCTGEAVSDVPKFLQLREVFPVELANDRFAAQMRNAYENFDALLAGRR